MINCYGNYRNRKFSDIWPAVEGFINDYNQSGLYTQNNRISQASTSVIYYLLYAEYGNSTIASFDEQQFKMQVFKTIFEYGPTWEKELEVQNALRSLTAEELETGSKQIFNTALNPGTAPTTDELDMVSQQNVTKTKRSKVESYAMLLTLLKTDVTSRFITHFKKYFLQIVLPERPLWYVTTAEEDEEV